MKGALGLVMAQAHVEAAAGLDRGQRLGHGVDHHGRVGADHLLGRGQDRGLERRGAVAPALELQGEVVFHGVHQHLAVVVADHAVALGGQPVLERVAVGDVAVVRAVEVGLAGDLVGLGVVARDVAEGGPAHLAAEDPAAQARDAQTPGDLRGRAHVLEEGDLAGLGLDRRAGGVVASVLEHAQERAGDLAEVGAVALAAQADDSAHGDIEPKRRGPCPLV